jgi:hypothetical protein
MKTPLKFVLIVMGEQKLVVLHSKIRICSMNVENILTTIYLEKLFHSFLYNPHKTGKSKIVRRKDTTILPQRHGNYQKKKSIMIHWNKEHETQLSKTNSTEVSPS